MIKRSKSYSARAAKVSVTAQKTLALIERGRFYKWEYRGQERKVIKELLDAGLIDAIGRVVTVERCYVPTSGYKPYKPEEFAK